jgi:hypothetical protein
MSESVRINHLSERGRNIIDHLELMDSIEDTDSVWNELYEYIMEIESCKVEEGISIEEKAKEVRRWFSNDAEFDRMILIY